MPELPAILAKAVALKASDVLIVPNEAPIIRLDGKVAKMTDIGALPAAETQRMLLSTLTPKQLADFQKSLQVDLSLTVPGVGRFRANVFVQYQGVAAAFRPLAPVIPTPEQVGIPEQLLKLCQLPRGLVLVTGPTGSGKTTTLAAMMEWINSHLHKHIITIEDPVEFVYQNKGSIVNQREIGFHTGSFSAGLRGALRQNPDIILIGEMRDFETIELAIRAAETGHLCFSTLHTQDAPSTIDRIISEFPTAQQNRARLQLSSVLCGVVSQILLPKAGGGRVCAREVMLMNSGIAALIRDSKIHQILSSIEAGKTDGMCSMDQSLAELCAAKLVEIKTAYGWAHDVSSLKAQLSRLNVALPAEVAEYIAPI